MTMFSCFVFLQWSMCTDEDIAHKRIHSESHWCCFYFFIAAFFLLLTLFLSLWLFQLYFIPWIFPTTLRFLTLFFLSYFCLTGPFNYISLYESLTQPWYKSHRLTFTRWGCCSLCLWHKPIELSHSFYSVLVSVSVFIAIWTVFYFMHSSDNSPLSHSVLPVLFLTY